MRFSRLQALPALLLAMSICAPRLTPAAGPHRPDVIVDPNRVADTWTAGFVYFPPGDCAIQEGCVGGAGLRHVISFSVLTANVGQYELELGDPTSSPLFQFSPCHGHYHLVDFSDYQIVDSGGSPLGAGHKQDWCISDLFQYIDEPWVPDPPLGYSCSYQGLTPGWADEYSTGIDCQWVDVTDLAPGDYLLKVEVNAGRSFQETDYTNNTVTTTVTVPDPAAKPDLVVDQPKMSSTWSVDKRLFRPGSLAIKDGCVGDYGYRRLLTFIGQVDNVGQGDFFLGDPQESPAFEYVPTHLHYHLKDFMQYQLLTSQGAPATAPRSQEFWFPFDWMPYLSDPWVRPEIFYRKGSYGLQRGWLNFTFTSSVDCQWLDVTDVPLGLYLLSATVNPAQVYAESDYSNNVSTVAVSVNEPLSWIPHRPDGHTVPGTPLSVEPDASGLRIDFDAGTCPAPGYNLYYSVQPPSESTYNGAVCDLEPQGSAVVSLPDPAPGSMVWFTVVGRSGIREGGHGFDSAGRERPLTGAGMCGITETLPRKLCPL